MYPHIPFSGRISVGNRPGQAARLSPYPAERVLHFSNSAQRRSYTPPARPIHDPIRQQLFPSPRSRSLPSDPSSYSLSGNTQPVINPVLGPRRHSTNGQEPSRSAEPLEPQSQPPDSQQDETDEDSVIVSWAEVVTRTTPSARTQTPGRILSPLLPRLTLRTRETMADARIRKLDSLYPYDANDPEDEPLSTASDNTEKMEILKYRKDRAQELFRRQQATSLTEAMKSMKVTATKSMKDVPKFHGKPGESAIAHLLTVADWKDREGMDQEEMKEKFSETLRDEARIWFHDQKHESWEELRKAFICEFDREGKSVRQLRSDWLRERFDPQREDIKVFIRRFNVTAELIDMNDDAIVAQLKEAMPEEMIAPLFDKTEKEVIEKLLISFYKAKAARAQTAAQNPQASNPFARLYQFRALQPTGNDPSERSYGEENDHLNPQRTKPFKPQIYQPKRRGPFPLKGSRPVRKYPSPPRQGLNRRPLQRRYGPAMRRSLRVDKPKPYDPRRPQRFINAKPRHPKIRDSDQDRQKRYDGFRCHHCKELGHWRNECPWLNVKQQLDKQPPFSVRVKGPEENSMGKPPDQVQLLQSSLAFQEAQAAQMCNNHFEFMDENENSETQQENFEGAA